MLIRVHHWEFIVFLMAEKYIQNKRWIKSLTIGFVQNIHALQKIILDKMKSAEERTED